MGGLPCGWLINSIDGTPMKEPRHPILADGKVRYVGDRVALVVADSVEQAKAAAALIEVDYDELPAVVDTATATAAPANVHDDAPGNQCYLWQIGDGEGTDAAIKGAAHVTTLSFRNNRLIPNAMEPRAANASYNANSEEYTLYVANQNPHVERLLMSAPSCWASPSTRCAWWPPTWAAASAAARSSCTAKRRRWCGPASRSAARSSGPASAAEAFLSDAHGRDHVTTADLAMDKDGKFLALRVNTKANLGAYLSTFSSAVPTILYATLAGRPVRHAQDPLHGAGGVHQHRAGGRLPRRRPARGHLRGRAHGGRRPPRRWASTRPRSAAATSSPPSRMPRRWD